VTTKLGQATESRRVELLAERLRDHWTAALDALKAHLENRDERDR